MKLTSKIRATILAGLITFSVASPLNVFADSHKVITLGANLNTQQKQMVLNYFGVKESDAEVITVNNQQERQYLSGVATEEQISTKTFSCSYIEPTEDGGVQAKLANVNWLTADMVSSTLTTAGVNNANVLVCAPFEVSGTGALTGIFLAYEKTSGEKLSEEKKQTATNEIVTTGDLADEIKEQQSPSGNNSASEGEQTKSEDQIAKDKATGIVNDIKADVIKNGTKDTTQIANTINNVCNNYNVTLSDGQKQKLQNLMEDISKQDYNYDEVKDTLNNVSDNVQSRLDELEESGFFDKIKDFFSNLFRDNKNDVSEPVKESSFFQNVNPDALGDNAVIQSTQDALGSIDTEQVKEQSISLWQRFVNWVSGLFGGEGEDKSEQNNDNETDSQQNKSNSLEDNTEQQPVEDSSSQQDQSVIEDSSSPEDNSQQDQTSPEDNSQQDQTTVQDNSGVDTSGLVITE